MKHINEVLKKMKIVMKGMENKEGGYMELSKNVKYKDTSIGNHISELVGICDISDKSFIKFYKKYMGESISPADVLECRVILTHMIAKQIIKECEVLLHEFKIEV